VRDGDVIQAVIKGSAINNDGSDKIGFTAPSVTGQAAVIGQALAMADVSADTIGYVEAHGTGTSLGDPIEIAALTKAFREHTPNCGYCAIGSVKTNIGHLDAGAGVAGLIKAALALRYGAIPASLNFNSSNPQIDFATSPFFVNTRLTPWKRAAEPRRAGVSSFGIGGTNAHVIVEEAPDTSTSPAATAHQLLVISAKTASALDQATLRLAAHLRAQPAENLADVAYTLQTGRAAFTHRRCVAAGSPEEAARALEAADSRRVYTDAAAQQDPPVVFMFPGQGAQYVNMGADIYRTEPVFRDVVDRCATILQPLLGLDLRSVLFAAQGDAAAAEEQLHQTRITQPALFTVEYALAQLLQSWGIKPVAMIGHSVGEYVAGCVAGVFTLDEALMLIARRGQLVQAQPPGTMLAVRLPESDVRPLLSETLDIAAINAPRLCVVAGPHDADGGWIVAGQPLIPVDDRERQNDGHDRPRFNGLTSGGLGHDLPLGASLRIAARDDSYC
jgi:acyl transferase domain-containing protein